MAYRFKLQEPLGKGVRRIGLEQIDAAIERLSAISDPVLAVHESRKSFKRIRALLRLARPGIGEQSFRRENVRYRDIGRLLATARDQHVLLQTVAGLEAGAGDGAKDLVHLRTLIAESNGHAGAPAPPADPAKALEMLKQGRHAFERLKLEPAGIATIGEGLERCYRQGRKSLAAAYAQPSDEAFHEWRKTVQQHWRHMSLLSRGWPDYFQARATTAKRLSTLLGEDHDLALVLAFVAAVPKSKLPRAQALRITRLCRDAQEGRRAVAALLGDRLFGEAAEEHARLVVRLWEGAARLRELEPRAVGEAAAHGDDEAASRPDAPKPAKSGRAAGLTKPPG